MIVVEKVSKHYCIAKQQMVAAEDVSLQVKRGEMIAIVGHSGSGKTTLLSIVGGLTRPDGGKVTIDGIDIWAMKDPARSLFRNRRLSFIYQFASLIPTLNVVENITLPAAFGTRGTQTVPAMEILERLGMEDKAGFFPSQLSGGQQRRVAIARAFASAADIVLADEPTGDLDQETEADIIRLFREMNESRGTTMVIVTHEETVAASTHRRFFMKNGLLEPVNSPPKSQAG